MSGILVTYQGLVCDSVTFRRRRGYAADVSEVKLAVTSFPGKFDWSLPAPGGLIKAAPQGEVDLTGILGDEMPPPNKLPAGLKHEGTLVIAGVRPDGSQYEVVVPSLFVRRIDTEVSDDVNKIQWVTLQLVDARFFWVRGVISRWSFARVHQNGTVSRDSLNEDGSNPTLAQILEEVIAPALFRSPGVTNVPDAWGKSNNVDFEPWGSALRSLSVLVNEGGAEVPCLRLDGTLAVHGFGEGKVGWAKDGKGANVNEFPDGVLLDLGGAGQGFSTEAVYPEDYVLIVGKPRVVTVAVDDWEAVIMHPDGAPRLLSEEFVRLATNGLKGLDWLRAFVMQPLAMRSTVEAPPDVLDLFREQAFRYWRLPGAGKIVDGFYNGDDGPNAHLITSGLLPQAQIVNKRRVPVAVETYRWEQRHKTLIVGGQGLLVLAANETMATLRRLVASRSIQAQLGFNPLESGAPPDALLYNSYGVKGGPGEIVQVPLDDARRVHFLSETLGGSIAQRWDAALKQMAEARGASFVIRYELAKKLAQLEQDAKKLGIDDPGKLGSINDQIRKEVSDAGKRLELLAEREQAESAASVTAVSKGQKSAIALENLPRGIDAGARVVSHQYGVIKTSGLAGHAERTDVPTPALTSLELCPVRVSFGATLRPRIDVLPGKKDRPTTGEKRKSRGRCSGGQGFVPKILSDSESHYVAAFKRVGRGAAQVTFDETFPLDQAIPVRRPWVELIPLGRTQGGEFVSSGGNRGSLDAQALKVAQAIFDKPTRVSGSKHALGDAWPIQCDGVVAGVTITTEFVDERIPAGFTTVIDVGSNPPAAPGVSRPRQRDQFIDAFQREAFGA